MKEELKNGIEALADDGPLATFGQFFRTNYGINPTAQEAEESRTRVLSILKSLDAALRKRALKVSDLPDSLEVSLKKVLIAVQQIRQTNDWVSVTGPLKSILDLRKVLSAEILASAAEKVGVRIDEGYEAVRRAEEAATKSDASRKRTEGAETSSAKSAVVAADAAKLAVDAKKTTESNASTSASELTKATTARKTAETDQRDTTKAKSAAQRAANYALSMSKASEKTKKVLDDLLIDETGRVDQQEIRRQAIEEDLEKTRKKARTILFEATTAALAKEWRAKRWNAQLIALLWLLLLIASVLLAVCSSAFMAVPQLFANYLPPDYLTSLKSGDASFQHQVLTKLFVVPPLLFAVWFSASQYGHTRDRQLEYGKRETLAKTLEAYQLYLVGLKPGDSEWEKEVLQLFKTSIEKLYEFLLAPSAVESGPSLSIFRRKDVSLEDLPKVLSEIKALGIKVGE